MAKRQSRWVLTALAGAMVGAGLLAAFWPRPILVDMAQVSRGDVIVTINEEGRTRVHDAYLVSTPVAGRLLRTDVDPGDAVEKDRTIVARMRPTNPAALDVRTREQARASVTAAQAALRVAQADMNKAIADRALAESDLERAQTLVETDRLSQAALERATREARAAEAVVDRARAAISVRTAELANARAQLIGFDDRGLATAIAPQDDDAIPLYAPATGLVLQVIQQSETTLPVGAPILQIGNIDDDLEIVAELLSRDAVQVSAGDRVIVDKWGGAQPLSGRVERVDPIGFTKFSALGVEEQRVNVVIAFSEAEAYRGRLGHGFRVEVRIVVQEESDTLTVPASALFEGADGWSVFVVEAGQLVERPVTLSANNGLDAAVAEGVSEGETLVLYPAASLNAGTRVAPR